MEDTTKMSLAWDQLIAAGIATEGELILATRLCGYKMGTLEDVLYVLTGYNSFEQLKESKRYSV